MKCNAIDGLFTKPSFLFSNYLDQYPFFSPSVKFTVKDLFPRAKIQFPICYCNNHLTSHNLPFHVGICIILTHIMPVLGYRFMGRQFFEPDVIVLVKSGFVLSPFFGRSPPKRSDCVDCRFFLPHSVYATSSTLIEFIRWKGPYLFFIGLIGFFAFAIQVYRAKIKRKGMVNNFVYLLCLFIH